MKSVHILIALMLLSWQFARSAEFDSHIGTWELRKFEMTERTGREYQVHRLVLTADGQYLNSATRGGPIAVNYKLQEDQSRHGWYSFPIETSDDHQFGRAAGVRVDKRGLVMTYFDGRVLTYTRVSSDADKDLLVNPEGKKLTNQANKNQAEQDGADQPATAPESKSEDKEKSNPQSEERSQ